MKFYEEISIENIKNSITKYPFQTISLIIIALVFLVGFSFMENSVFMQNMQQKIDDFKQRMVVSLIVKNGEIQNTNSWSFSNMTLYLLEFFDMV
jgi:hypothetical protein